MVAATMTAQFVYPAGPVRRLVSLAAVLLLAACQSTPTVAPSPSAARPAAVAADGLLRGEILLPPGALPPAQGRLQLALVERFEAARSTLARSEVAIDGLPPYRFSLPFARAAVADISVYRLEVSLFGADGRLLYASDGEHPVNLGVEAEPTRVALMALDADNNGPRHLDCGEFLAELQYADPDLTLVENGQPHRLRRAHATVGRRYIGADAELWMDEGEARLQLGPQRIDCTPLR